MHCKVNAQSLFYFLFICMEIKSFDFCGGHIYNVSQMFHNINNKCTQKCSKMLSKEMDSIYDFLR